MSASVPASSDSSDPEPGAPVLSWARASARRVDVADADQFGPRRHA